jgi:FAD/FMN-containing dehydrogenase
MTHTLPLISPHPDAPAILVPGDTGYDRARSAWNLVADQRPAAVAIATTAAQVAHAVRHAADRGLRVAVQATGHQAGPLGALDDALLLRTALHDQVRFDPIARTARVGAGAVWEDVVRTVAPYRLGAVHGSAPDVGVVGYTLGGGLSLYGRRHGLAANHVRGMDVVGADGELRRVDADREPDLFWALRGGGGGFGVVCSMDFDLVALDGVYAGATFWPVEHAPAVLAGWLEWCRTAPDGVTTALRILRLPPLPGVPEPLRDVPVVTIDGVVCEDLAGAEALVAPLRRLAPAMIDHWGPASPVDVLRVHAEPEEPTPALGDHLLLEDLDERAVDALLAVAGAGSGSPLVQVELRQLGGALARPPAGGGARSALEGAFALFALGVPMDADGAAAIDAHLRLLVDALAPWSTGTVYLNFAERGRAAERGFAAGDLERLRRLRAAWDPGELFASAHPIAPEASA